MKIADIRIQDGTRVYHEYYLVKGKREANAAMKLHKSFETDSEIAGIHDVSEKEIKTLQKFGVI